MKYLYFRADWCGPCRTVGPSLDEVTKSGITVEKVDVDNANNAELVSQFNIQSIPTVILVNNNMEEITRIRGNQQPSVYIITYNNNI